MGIFLHLRGIAHQSSFITTFVLDQTDQLQPSSNRLSSPVISLHFLLLSSAGYLHRKLCNHNCQIPTKEGLTGKTRKSTLLLFFLSFSFTSFFPLFYTAIRAQSVLCRTLLHGLVGWRTILDQPNDLCRIDQE